jgi:hypothetical protein
MLGGKISESYVFNNILSIGYELEVSHLIKLSKVSNDEGNEVLMNTDTSRDDIDILESGEIPQNKAEFYDIRSQEKYDLTPEENPFINSYDPNVKFYITNDIAETPFVKHLGKICPKTDDDEDKNDIYEYITSDGETYDINFEFWSEASKLDCSSFSDVEWIATYYKPPKSSNVILNTLVNVLEIVIYHLDHLVPIQGNLLLKREGQPRETVDMSSQSYLLHMPDTNLYYFKTNAGTSIDNIGVTIQMTFGCKIQNAFSIMKEILSHTEYAYECFSGTCERTNNYLNQIVECTNLLFKRYNETTDSYKFDKRGGKFSILLAQVKDYFSLILYKLYIYYNLFLGSPTKYFKNKAAFNLRHTGYDCYLEIKKSIISYFSVNETIAIKIIHKLFLEPDILISKLLEDPGNTHVQIDAFNDSTDLEKDSENYGDPAYSLKSYLTFFEDPIIPTKIKSPRSARSARSESSHRSLRSHRSARSARSESSHRSTSSEYNPTILNDWLEYNLIDAFSNKMKINDNIVLIEYRSFPRILDNYIHTVLPRKRNKHIGNLNIGVLKEFVEKEKSTGRGKTKKLKRKRKGNTKRKNKN